MKSRLLACVGPAALLLAIPGGAAAATTSAAPSAPTTIEGVSVPAGATAVPGQLLVRLADDASASERRSVRTATGVRRSRSLAADGVELLTAAPGTSLDALQARVERLPEVETVQRNVLLKIASVPTDPLFGYQWNLHNTGPISGWTADADIDAPEAWDTARGSGVTVAVLDTGVDASHPDLSGALWQNSGEVGLDGNGADKRYNNVDDDANGFVDDWRGWDFVDFVGMPGDNDPADVHGHGSHVAGIVGARANNGVGISGVAPEASVMNVAVANSAGLVALSWLIDGLDYAVAEGAEVVNGSIAGTGEPMPIVADFIADHPEVTFVFAAGNGPLGTPGFSVETTPTYPCTLPGNNLICVGATNAQDQRPVFSNFGAVGVDLSAPGDAILSTYPLAKVPSGYGLSNGTSMAAPHVAGAAAVLAGLHPNWTPAQIRARLMETVDKKLAADSSVTAGRLNLNTAVHAVDTVITGGPANGAQITDRTPTFTFTASPAPAGVTFQCTVNYGAWVPCTSGFTTPEYSSWIGMFAVRSVVNGAPDPTPASRMFTFGS